MCAFCRGAAADPRLTLNPARLCLRRRAQPPQEAQRYALHLSTADVAIFHAYLVLRNSAVMRACEGCRRRKIKCDAATTNTWPCSACVRLKLHCVRPNGFDGSTTEGGIDSAPTMQSGNASASSTPMSAYDPSSRSFSAAPTSVHGGYSQQSMINTAPKAGGPIYQQPSFAESQTNLFQAVQYPDAQQQSQPNLHYASVNPAVNVVDESYASHNVFPTPPMHGGPAQENSPGSYSQDSYGQPDLADLLGSLKVNEAGTGKHQSAPRWVASSAFPTYPAFPCVNDWCEVRSDMPRKIQHHICGTRPPFDEKRSP